MRIDGAVESSEVRIGRSRCGRQTEEVILQSDEACIDGTRGEIPSKAQHEVFFFFHIQVQFKHARCGIEWSTWIYTLLLS